MREDEGQVYVFTPAGAKYHLNGCFVTDRNPRSFGLTPCPTCAVGHFFPMYEGCERQVYYADTHLRWPPAHYHVDKSCGRTYDMKTKDMCLHCVDTQKMKMKIARLALTRPYTKQCMRAGLGPPPEHTMSVYESAVLRTQLWG